MLTHVNKSDSFCRALRKTATLRRNPMPKKTLTPKKSKASTSAGSEASGTAKARGSKVRLSNHKPRGRWFQARTAWPVREAPVHTLIRERERANKSLPPAPTDGAKWECVGPANIGGRITSLICHPTRPEQIWV